LLSKHTSAPSYLSDSLFHMHGPGRFRRRLQNQAYLQGVYCNITKHCLSTIFGVTMHTANTLKITMVLRLATSS